MQPDDDLGHVNHHDMKDLSTFVIGQDRIEGADRLIVANVSRRQVGASFEILRHGLREFDHDRPCLALDPPQRQRANQIRAAATIRCLAYLSFDGTSRSFEIAGVVGDAKYLDLRRAAPRTVDLNPFQESRMFSHRFSIRTDVAPLTVATAVQPAIGDTLTTTAIANVTTLADQVNPQ